MSAASMANKRASAKMLIPIEAFIEKNNQSASKRNLKTLWRMHTTSSRCAA